MIFYRLILLLVACLIGCVYSAPISTHLHNDVGPSLELFTPRAPPPNTSKKSKPSSKQAVHTATKNKRPTTKSGHAGGNAGGNTAAKAAADAAEADNFKSAIDQHFHPEHSKSLFWSGTWRNAKGVASSVKPEARQCAEKLGRKTIGDALKEAKIPESRINKNPHSQDIWDHASRVLAEKASGEVYVVLGGIVRPDGVYNRIEKPTLMNNKAVTKIVEWNVQTNKETQIKP